MRMIAIIAVLLAGTVSARADIIGTGPGYGSDAQAAALCILYNAGSTSFNVSSIKIIQENYGPISTLSCCTGSVQPGHYCGCYAHIGNLTAHACKAVVSAKTNVRGTFTIRNSSGDPLYSEMLR